MMYSNIGALGEIEKCINIAIKMADLLYINTRDNPGEGVAVLSLLASLRAKDGALQLCREALEGRK